MDTSGGGQLLLRSGVPPIDERLGGLTAGKPYLLTGAPGSGKTTVCLGFLKTALSEGMAAALVTEDDPGDIVAHASSLGLDLRRAAATGRFSLVCYKKDFVQRFARTPSGEPLLDELVRVVGPGAPDCLAIDSVAPFVDAGSPSAPGVTALVHALERLRSTTLVTYPGDVRESYDRRLDALVRRCAAVVHLSSYGEGTGRLDVVKARTRLWSDSPSFFALRPGHGVVPLEATTPSGDGQQAVRFRRQILVIPGFDGIPEDLLAALHGAFSVTLQEGSAGVMPETLAPDVGAVLVASRWDGISDVRAFLIQLRQGGNRTPVILLTRGDVRSSDRADAVLAGFDEVLADSIAPPELVARVGATVRRGRSTALPLARVAEKTSVTLSPDHAVEGVDEIRFRVAVEAALGESAHQVFSVLFLSPDEGELQVLLAAVARTIRAESGDLVAIVGERVAVYLPATRRVDAVAFLRRVSGEWRRAGHRELRTTQLTCPADRERCRAELRLPAAQPARVSTG
jgi:archaellum biogenesis ATPase FlaH